MKAIQSRNLFAKTLASLTGSLLISCASTHAHMNAGANCASCHGTISGNVASLSGNLVAPTTLSVNPRLDNGSTATLPTFTARAGETITVTLRGAPPSSGDTFALTVGGKQSIASGSVPGVKNLSTNKLTYTLASGWTTQTTGGTYYTQGLFSNVSSMTKTFSLTVGAATPSDVYSLIFRTTGLGSNKWTQAQEFLINVIPSVPSVTTGTTTGISAYGGTLNGSANPNGAASSAFFQFGTTNAYGFTTGTASLGSGNSAISITGTLSGLVPATLYHYRLVAIAATGTIYGSDATFTTTQLQAPAVVTGAASAISSQGGTLNGTVNPGSQSTTAYFVYGLDTNYGSSTPSQSLGAGGTSVAATALLTGLSDATAYHYKLVAVNASGTTQGLDQSFTTLAAPNAKLASLALNNGVLNPSFSSGNLSYSAGVANKVSSVVVTPVAADAGATIGVRINGAAAFTPVLSGNPSAALALLPGDNILDIKVTASDTVTSKTYTVIVSRVQLPVTGNASVSQTTATLEGTVDGRANSAYFQYGLTATYGSSTAGRSLSSGSSSVLLSSTITGLVPASIYHYRVVQTSGAGFDYGLDKTFVTARSYPGPEVAAQGEDAPGIPGPVKFLSFGNPAINTADHIAFQGLVTGTNITKLNNSGIWLYTGSSGSLLARTGDAAEGGGVFATLRDPQLNDQDEVAFIGTVSGLGFSAKNNTGVWATTSGSMHLVARAQGDALDATGVKAAAILQVVLPDQGGVIFLANLVNGVGDAVATNNQGIWQESNGQLKKLVRKGDPLVGGTVAALSIFASPLASPGVVGQTRNFNTHGDLSFRALFTNGSQGNFIIKSGTDPEPVILKGDDGPLVSGSATKFGLLGNPIINDSTNTAFQAVLTGSAKGATYSAILAETGSASTLGLLAVTGAPAPDQNGALGSLNVFASLGDPVFNSNDSVAFIGKLKPNGVVTAANGQGIWVSTSGTLKLVARTLDQAPECPAGAKFQGFNQLVYPEQGGVVFLATLVGPGVNAANKQGVWAVDAGGNLHLVARLGDALVINGVPKIVSKLLIFNSTVGAAGQSRSFNKPGDLVYKVIFADKTQAIRKVVFP